MGFGASSFWQRGPMLSLIYAASAAATSKCLSGNSLVLLSAGRRSSRSLSVGQILRTVPTKYKPFFHHISIKKHFASLPKTSVSASKTPLELLTVSDTCKCQPLRCSSCIPHRSDASHCSCRSRCRLWSWSQSSGRPAGSGSCSGWSGACPTGCRSSGRASPPICPPQPCSTALWSSASRASRPGLPCASPLCTPAKSKSLAHPFPVVDLIIALVIYYQPLPIQPKSSLLACVVGWSTG